MTLHVNEEDEDAVDVEEDEDEGVPFRTSIFAELGDDRADVRACSAVWNMFVKASNNAGFDARTKNQKAVSAALQRRRQESGEKPNQYRRAIDVNEAKPEVEMGREKGDDGLTDKQRAVLHAYTALTREKGTDFNNGDVAARAGITGGTCESRSANVSSVMKRLRLAGLVAGPQAPGNPGGGGNSQASAEAEGGACSPEHGDRRAA